MVVMHDGVKVVSPMSRDRRSPGEHLFGAEPAVQRPSFGPRGSELSTDREGFGGPLTRSGPKVRDLVEDGLERRAVGVARV
jgi:hypothetical protein